MATRLTNPQSSLPKGYIDSNFLSFLNSQELVVTQIIGDGNCLFRSIADIVDKDQEKHPRYRRLATQHLILNKRQFEEFVTTTSCTFEQYISKMQQDGTWRTF